MVERIWIQVPIAQETRFEMSSLTNVTDGLLDIENSLTSELELGALLGKILTSNKQEDCI